jgi:hypothetical protein
LRLSSPFEGGVDESENLFKKLMYNRPEWLIIKFNHPGMVLNYYDHLKKSSMPEGVSKVGFSLINLLFEILTHP